MRKRKIIRNVVIGFAVLFVFAIWIFVIGFSSNQQGSFFNKGHNAVWIGHEWVDMAKTDGDVQKLVEALKSHQIDTVFVHVGPIDSDGGVKPEKYKYSIDFIEKAKRFAPDIKFQAWLGQVRSKIDLSDPVVRHNVAKLSQVLAEFVGFDGIHFDIEPVWDGDTDFIKMLEECRAILSDGKKISVALAEYIPSSVIWLASSFYEFENYNTEINFKSVAEFADQVVVMVYDTGINTDWLYRFLVSEQTIRVTDLIDDKEVFIAIPAYDDAKEGFDPKIENIKNGLKGLVNGLNNSRSNEDSFAGVAVYPYWDIDENEWKAYDEIWLGTR